MDHYTTADELESTKKCKKRPDAWRVGRKKQVTLKGKVTHQNATHARPVVRSNRQQVGRALHSGK